jgi:hypothetical protein
MSELSNDIKKHTLKSLETIPLSDYVCYLARFVGEVNFKFYHIDFHRFAQKTILRVGSN